MLDHSALPLIDPGASPKFYVSGLGRVTPMGPVALFTFYILRPEDGRQTAARMIEVELIAPVESVGPAFELAVSTLGARTMLNLAGNAIGNIINRTAIRVMQ